MRSPLAFILALMLVVLPHARAADKAEAEYQAARKAWFALKEDPARRKFRHNWQNVAGRFEAVAKRHPKSARAADALYTAAEMQRELSRISVLESDLRQAIGNYERLIAEHPKNTLADDAALALAHIYMERLGDPQKARGVVEHALKSLPRGDMHRKLTALRAELPAAATPRPTGKAVASRKQTSGAAGSNADSAGGQTAATAPTAPTPKQGTGSGATATASNAPGTATSTGAPTTATTSTTSTATTTGTTGSGAAVASAPSGSGSTAASAKGEPAERSVPPQPAILDAIARATRPQESQPAHAPASAPVEAPAPVAAHTATPSPNPSSARESAAVAAHAPAQAPAPAPAPAPPADPKEAKAKLTPALAGKDAEVTLAEQLGLKVRRVVIDAGHGGHDTGAIGKAGLREKDVTLAISKRVGEILTDAGLEVILTRDDDTFVRLEDRSRIANEARGDLFISIHCNAAESRKVRGIETFTLNVASDRYSIRLAARENAASEQSMSDLQFILADLTTKAHTEESERLARRVQTAMVNRLSPKYDGTVDLGTKQALFYVLLGARMPAILVETAFLSHPEDEKRLRSKSYQEELAQAIALGVQGFLEDRSRVAQVH